MSDTKWTVKLRDDQMDTLIQTLDYVIEVHGARIKSSAISGIDQFAHESSRDRLAEVRETIFNIRGEP